MFLETPREKSTVYRLGYQDLGTRICCIRLARETDPTERSCLQKNILDCLTQRESESNSGHLHTEEAENLVADQSKMLDTAEQGRPIDIAPVKC